MCTCVKIREQLVGVSLSVCVLGIKLNLSGLGQMPLLAEPPGQPAPTLTIVSDYNKFLEPRPF